MPAVKGGSYKGIPAEERQEIRRGQLLSAGLEIIGSEGLAAATVRSICSEAGLTSRFFYESFANIEELAAALFDDIFDRSTAAVFAAVETAPRDHAMRNRIAIETFVRELTDDRRIARLMFIETLGSELLTQRRLSMVRLTADALVQSKPTRRPTAKTASYRQVAATVMVGGLVELLISWMHGEIDAELDHIVEDYIQVVLLVSDATTG